MKYKIIDPSNAKDITEKILAGEAVPFDQFEREQGKGEVLPDSTLKKIASEVQAMKRKIARSGDQRELLDATAFATIHRELPPDPAMCADLRFWHRFAVVFLADVIKWRFPGKKGQVNLANFGLGGSRDQRENYLYKLWLRGELSRMAKGSDKYRPGRYGDVDFWTSHIHRQGFSECRELAHELLLFQYPPGSKGKPRLWPGEEKHTGGRGNNVRGIRTLVKELRRIRAVVEFSLLDAEEVRKILQELSRGLSGANGKPVST